MQQSLQIRTLLMQLIHEKKIIKTNNPLKYVTTFPILKGQGHEI